MLQKTTVPCVDDIEFRLENSRRATIRPPSSKSTFNPENPRRSTERPSGSGPTFSPEHSRWAMKGPSSSESLDGYKTARESFSDSDVGGTLLYSRDVLV